ncbi:MAG: hypothetical protein AABW92_04825 [Nanoarchaeota archaeon]
MYTPLEQKVVDELSPIKITSYAFDKANYISKRICELAERPLEIGFFLLSDSLSSTDDVIQDVYIGDDQKVRHLHCDITPEGMMKSLKYSRQNKKRIIGWGHSHANIGTFYSGEDDMTIQNLVRTWNLEKDTKIGVDYTKKEGYNIEYIANEKVHGLSLTIGNEEYFLTSSIFDDHNKNYNQSQKFRILKDEPITLKYFYGMTFNAANETPHSVIAYIDNTITRKIEQGVTYGIIPSKEIKEEEKLGIDREIISKVEILNKAVSNYKESILSKMKELKENYQRGLDSIDLFASDNNELKPLFQVIKTLGYTKNIINSYHFDSPIFSVDESLQEYKSTFYSWWHELTEKASPLVPLLENRLAEKKVGKKFHDAIFNKKLWEENLLSELINVLTQR